MKSLFCSFVLIIVLSGCGSTVVRNEALPGAPPPSNPFETVVVTGRVVNLRQGPGTQYAVVGSASNGDSLMVTGEAPEWYRVYVPEKSLFAWIYSGLTSGADLPQ
ncbi:MAG: SH3 domain-containing protein [bacterium]|nr:SH3 domain-containing protein [bacterium]